MRPSTLEELRRLHTESMTILVRDHRCGLTLRDVAAELASSPRQIQRAFALVGETSFSEELRAVRVKGAAELLRSQPGLSAAQVGALVGYPGPSHFTRVFRAELGVAPSEYRRRSSRSELRDDARRQ